MSFVKKYFLVCVLVLFGQLNAKDFYVLTWPEYNPGLYSVFFSVLGALDYYEKDGCIGMRVDMKQSGWYHDPKIGSNWWEYYFESVHVGSEEGAQIKTFDRSQMISFAIKTMLSMSRSRANELIEKYVKLKPHVEKKIEDFCKKHFEGHYVIGVHYRGTQKTKESPRVSYEEVYEEIISALPDGDFRIFVATDEEHFLPWIKEKFPNRVIALDAQRSTSGLSLFRDTSKDPYLKGEEAIIDCTLLSKTQLLLKCTSNLSDCSLFLNPSLPVIMLNEYYQERLKKWKSSLPSNEV